jgi:hypothetical protein
MKTPRVVIALTVVNIVLVLLSLGHLVQPALADAPAAVLRARALQIVDEQGRVRASLAVLPASTSADGVTSQETVLLRLITERGRPNVKIGASEQESGVSFAGPTGTKDTYAILAAKATESSLRLRSEDGRAQILKP